MQPKVLVPLDGMPLAETALPLARMMAQALQGRLELLRVVAPDAPESADADALAYLADLANLDTWLRVLRGAPADCIVREAIETGARLIVMSTHARSGLRRAVLGSVAEAVVAHAPASTVLVRGPATRAPRLRRFLLAVDSTCAAPVQTVLELARAAGADVVLLRVVRADETAIWQWKSGEVLDDPQVVTVARQELQDLAAYLEAAGITAHVRVRIGEPAPTIASTAQEMNADLIVMATHARTGGQRSIIGSVADAVVHASSVPVLLTRLVPMTRRRTGRFADRYSVEDPAVPRIPPC